MPTRRDLYRIGTTLLGGVVAFGLAIPGVAYVLDPLRRKAGAGARFDLTRLSALPVGEPRPFPIIAEKTDSWVKYPPEAVGTVWLLRQPEGAEKPVIAFTGECPHLGCAIGLADGGKTFLCPCHMAKYALNGRRKNLVSPRDMDTLDVELTGSPDPLVSVTFQRYRNLLTEKIPLV